MTYAVAAGARDFRNPPRVPPGFSSLATLLHVQPAMGRARGRPRPPGSRTVAPVGGIVTS